MKTIGYVNVKIKHHYHGNKEDRQYVDRWNILEKYNFDPNTFYNSAILESGYLYYFLREIRDDISQNFRNDLLEYFNNRKEDNIVVKHEIQNIINPKIVYSAPPPNIKSIRRIPRANKKNSSKIYVQSYITPENTNSIYCDNNSIIYPDYEHHEHHEHHCNHNNSGFSPHHPSY